MRRCLRMLAASLVALLVVSTIGAAAQELELLRTLGAGEDDVQIHRPGAIAFAADGSAYLCNDGDCRILQFDREWRLASSFARCGEGPGEFEQCTGLLIEGDELWIFEPARVTIFDLDGRYLETRRSRHQLAAPTRVGTEILCRLSTGGRAVAVIDAGLEIVSRIGPMCPVDDPRARARRCAHLQILPHPDYRCLLVNPLDGRLDAIGDDGRLLETRRLHDETGDTSFEQGDGFTVTRFRPVLGRSFVDEHANLWCLIEHDGDDLPQRIEVRDRRFVRIADYTLPQGVTGFLLACSPRDELILLDYAGSRVHILDMPHLRR